MTDSLVTSPPVRRRLVAAAVALLAAIALLPIVTSAPAAAHETCTGAVCEAVVFVDGQGRFSISTDLGGGGAVRSFYFGNPKDEPLMGDWDCDGEQTPAAYRRSEGRMYLRNTNTAGVADSDFYFGIPGDIPLVGDFNGDGCDTLSIYRPSMRRFYITNRLGPGFAELSFSMTASGTVPLAGDWNGDGIDTVGLRQPSTGIVSLRNANSSGPAHVQFLFGIPGDDLLTGDWDGDGRDTVGVYRGSTLYLRNDNSAGFADLTFQVGSFPHAIPASGIASVGGGGVSLPPPPSLANLTPSGPVVLSGESGVVISGLAISNPDGPCVWVGSGSDVTITANAIGPCGDEAVYVYNGSSIEVSNNVISDSATGVIITDGSDIQVEGNQFSDAGRNFVLFDNVTGEGNRIRYNVGSNTLGESNAEDLINLFGSYGTWDDPIQVVGNTLRNGGPSGSGSGILAGDGGGSHQLIQDNRLINPGQAGIGIASGDDIRVLDNVLYSDSYWWSNVGIYVWNQYGDACWSNEVRGNQVNWTNASGEANPRWDGGNCGAIDGWDDNDWYANVGP